MTTTPTAADTLRAEAASLGITPEGDPLPPALWIAYGETVTGGQVQRIVSARSEAAALQVANDRLADVLFTSAWRQGDAWE